MGSKNKQKSRDIRKRKRLNRIDQREAAVEASRQMYHDTFANIPAEIPIASGDSAQKPMVPTNRKRVKSKQPPGEWFRDEDGELSFGNPPNRITNSQPQFIPLLVESSGTRIRHIEIPQVSDQPSKKTENKLKVTPKAPDNQPIYLFCHFCSQKVLFGQFKKHQQGHLDTCPICNHSHEGSFSKHLLEIHHVLCSMSFKMFFVENWQNKKLFVCSNCYKRLSKNDCLTHACSPTVKKVVTELPENKTVESTEKDIQPVFRPKKPDEDKRQKFTCSECGIQVRSQMILYWHLSIEHPQCPCCNRRFPKGEFAAHIHAAHPKGQR